MDRLIQLISINNGLITELRKSNTGIIQQYLKNHGYNAECKDYYYFMYSIYSKIEYNSYVAEIADLPRFITMIKNYRSDNDNFIDGIEDDFSEYQLNILADIDKDVDQLMIPNNSIFGFTVTYITYFYISYYALKLRNKNPNITIVFGGYHMDLSGNIRDFTLKSGIADVVVKDDGCQPMLDIIEGRLTHGSVTGTFNKDMTWPELNRTDVIRSRYTIPFVTSVGCPNKCAFCASSRPYVRYELDNMYEYLMRTKKRTNFTGIEMEDDIINPTEARGLKICDMIEKVGVEHWHSFGLPRMVTKDFADGLSRSGAGSIFLGVEGFSDRLYALMKKAHNQNTENSMKAITRVVERNITCNVGLIVGLPGESDEDDAVRFKICGEFKEKYDTLFNLCPTVFKVFPNSNVYTTPDLFGITFTSWEDEYIDALPDLSDIVVNIPKKFSIDGLPRSVAKERVDRLRSAYCHKMFANNIGENDKQYAEKGAFDDDVV